MKNSSRRSVGNRFTWGRWSLAASLAAGLLLSLPATAQADATPDVAVTQTGPLDPTLGTQYKSMAQTFKVRHSGQLYQVDLHYGNNWFATSVKAQLWSLSAQGLPTGSPVASVPAPRVFPFTTDWHTFVLTSRVQVSAGQTFAIVLTSTTVNSNRWSYNAGANYTDGTMLAQVGSLWMPFNLGAGSAFLFREWVDTGAQTPSVTADQPSGASADEATAPAMTGTYTNPAGGGVQLAADHGKVTDLGAGKWSWTGDVYDEDAAPASITIKLTDSLNQTASTTFPLTIKALKPTVSISTSSLATAASTASSSITNPEGTTLVLHGSATSRNPADQAGVFTYAWKVTMNGVAQPDGSSASYSIPTVDEGDTWVASLTATDDGGMASDKVTVTVVGAEVRPTPTITSITPSDSTLTFVAPEETINFNGTYADPSTETHTFRWDFGDGASATTLAASHAYAVGGTYTVTLTAKDDEGVAGTATATVTVLTTQQALAAMVKYVQGVTTLNAGQQNSLIAKLNAASDSAARGDNKAASNQLNAFLNELEADLRTGKISPVAYNALRADAHALQGALGTYNRFLEWWPLPA